MHEISNNNIRHSSKLSKNRWETGTFGIPSANNHLKSCVCVWSLQNGNITELLLKEGFARCVDWSMAVYTQGAEKLRAAERSVLLSRTVVCPIFLYISNMPDISAAGLDSALDCLRLLLLHVSAE